MGMNIYLSIGEATIQIDCLDEDHKTYSITLNNVAITKDGIQIISVHKLLLDNKYQINFRHNNLIIDDGTDLVHIKTHFNGEHYLLMPTSMRDMTSILAIYTSKSNELMHCQACHIYIYTPVENCNICMRVKAIKPRAKLNSFKELNKNCQPGQQWRCQIHVGRKLARK